MNLSGFWLMLSLYLYSGGNWITGTIALVIAFIGTFQD